MKLSEKITLLRKENGWSQEQLAGKLDVSRQAIYKWEADIAIPEIEKLKKLSSIFNVSLDELLNEDTPLPNKNNPIHTTQSPKIDEVEEKPQVQAIKVIVPPPKKPKLPFIVIITVVSICAVALIAIGVAFGINELTKEHEHNFGSYSVVTPSTCVTAGKEKRVCKNCGAEETRPLALSAHSEEVVKGNNPTCTTDGLTDGKKCSKCNKIIVNQEVIFANGHTNVDIPPLASTCIKVGLTGGKMCSVCKITLSVQMETPALGHDEVSYVAQKATCTAIGWEAYQTCSRCDYTTYEEIPANGHTDEEIPAVEPNCTEVGYTAGVKCSVCDTVTTEPTEVAALGHDWKLDESKLTNGEPTCETEGNYPYYCNRENCDATSINEEGQKPQAIKHAGYVVGEFKTAPTCTAAGVYNCSDCGEDFDAYEEDAQAFGHDYIDHEAKEETCTEIGWEAYQTCSRCDYTTYEEIEALDHEYIDHEAQEATCTEIGWATYKTCSKCDYTTYEEIKALGHIEVVLEEVKPTCTKAGITEGMMCSTCDAVLVVQNVINAQGHHFVNSVCDKCGFSSNASEGLEYALNESTNTYAVTGIGTCEDANIVIPDTYEGLPVTIIEESAFHNCYSIVSVSIPDSVTNIERLAFWGCTALESVTLSDSITNMSDGVFGKCESLKYYEYGNSYYLGTSTNPYYALIQAKNSDIIACTINEDTKVLVSGAFRYCRNLTEINYNAISVYDLGEYTYIFGGTSTEGITVNIGKNVKEIPSRLFSGSSSSDAPQIVKVVFESGSKCERIGYAAFNSCDDIAAVYYNDDIAGWLNINFESGGSNPLAYENSEFYIKGEKLLKLVIPDEITEIKPYAFNGYHKLLSVTLHQNVTSIGNYAFGDGCAQLVEIYNLSEISLTSGVKDNGYISLNAKVIHNRIENESIINIVDDYVFLNESGKYSLLDYVGNETEITLPLNYNGDSYAIADYGFYRSNLKKIVISSGVTSIGDHAIWVCPNLQSITIGENVTDIGMYAFGACERLTEIYFNATSLNSCSYINFQEAGTKTDGIKLTIGKNVTKLPENLFTKSSSFYAPKITSVEFEEGSVCQSIGKYVFSKCTSLTSIIIPESVTIIDFGAFDGCTALTVYCEATKQPTGWNSYWSDDLKAVYWYTNGTPTESGNYWYYGANGKIIAITVQ